MRNTTALHDVKKGTNQTFELIKDNKVSKVDRLPEIVRCRPKFSDEQVDHFLACADPQFRPMFGFMRETGCQLSEAMTLKQTQVHRKEGRVIFTDTTKSGKFRVVPMTEECQRWIDAIPPLAECPWVFFNPRARTRWKCARKLIDGAIEKSGLEGFLVKDLRRHFGIALSEKRSRDARRAGDARALFGRHDREVLRALLSCVCSRSSPASFGGAQRT